MSGFIATLWLGQPLWLWLGFFTLVLVLLVLDLGLLNKRDEEIGIAQSLKLSAFYISVALAFGGFVWWQLGPERALEYYTGFAIEKALSIDNVFVIAMIFSFFAIPARYQYRALVWGILAVIIMRGIMIALGAALVESYGWVLYIFGGFLVATGIKMLIVKESEPDIAKNPLVKFLKKRLNVTDQMHQQRFFVRLPHPETGKTILYATPLFLALVVINVADLVFAVDSVPAIFAITTDTFIVYTANIMAILGLRALYFALAAMITRFAYLKYALALVLVFIGLKIFWNEIFGKVNPAISLSVTLALIAGGVLVSLWKTRDQAKSA